MRLIRQFLTEILLLFLLGGIAGFAIPSVPSISCSACSGELRTSTRSRLAGACGVCCAVSASRTIFGLAPAWLMSVSI